MPDLSPEEVERFVALGKEGWDRFKAGDIEGAEAAFRAQIRICSFNPEPFVSLALLEAGRGSKDAAMDRLHAAVVRGFGDLRRVERSEAWSRMPRTTAFLKLQDAVILTADILRTWPGWDFRVWRAPEDLDGMLRQHDHLVSRVEAMAPALGPRHTRLWNRLIERATAAMLQAYVERRPQAPDLGKALDRLMALYSGGLFQRWERLPKEVAGRLAEVSNVALERFPESATRPTALVGVALGRYAERDKRGALLPSAAQEIRTALEEVVTRHADSPLLAAAVVGLVRTEAETGRLDRAEVHYRQFREGHAADRALLYRVQGDLGELALRVGGLPEFRATTLGGETVGPEALRGKVVVLDFWATWCPPCVEGFPALRKIDERHGDDVVVLGVNLDFEEALSAEALREWIAREQVPGDHIHDGLAWDSELVKAFGVSEIPFNVVVGADGAVLAVNEEGRRLEKAVKAAIHRKPAAQEADSQEPAGGSR